jgi:putative hydrolase of HD superfamily
MKSIANLLFEAKMLKEIPRSGYQFLGSGNESVAEHSFITAFIALVMSQMAPEIDALKLISMCLLHDLPEARTGDLNYVQKNYVTADEQKAVADATRDVPFGKSIAALLAEYQTGASPEALLAHDADQLALILDLKSLADTGYPSPNTWMPAVTGRLKTQAGRALCESILQTHRDEWWLNNSIDSAGRTH